MVRYLYGQADNAKAHKCLTNYAGFAALVAYGVCVKAKLSFGLANHNHTDIDAYIGTVITGVCNSNLVTFPEFESACIAAVSKTIPVVGVEEIVNVPDYDNLFSDFNDGNITGTSDLHLLRIEGLAVDERHDGAPGLLVHYKEDLRDLGYQPKPVYHGNMPYLHWNKYFSSPSNGKIMKVDAVPQEKVPGRRLSWSYTVTYADSSMRYFNLPCPSLPVKMNAESLNEKITGDYYYYCYTRTHGFL